MDRPVALGVMIVGLTVLSAQAPAQTPPAAPVAAAPAAPAAPTTMPSVDISKETRTSSGPQSDEKAINAFINANVQNLLSDNPGAQQIGRDKLERIIAGVGSSNAPSTAFVNYYIGQLGKALLPAVQSKNVRTRLNAGIVIYRVSYKAQDTQLQSLALMLMKDKADAVSLWGVKSAGAMIPQLVAGSSAANNAMIQEISKAVAGHKSAAIAQEAYQALSLGIPDIKIQLLGAGPAIDEILNVFEVRLKRYLEAVPEDPASEKAAITFLTSEKIIAVLTPPQKARSLQLISDVAQLGAGQFLNATARPDKEQLALVISFAGKGLLVAAAPAKGDPLEDALTKVGKTNVNSNPAQVLADVTAMFGQLQKKYPALKPAQKPTAPTTAPATTAPALTAPAAVAPAAAPAATPAK